MDLWFQKRVKACCEGDAFILRYADDFLCAFQYREEAERFYQALPDRLSKFNLAVAPEKTRIIRFSRFHPGMQRRIDFLGFETYWMMDSKGVARIEQRTARKRLHGACRRIKKWIKDNRHLKGGAFIEALNRRLRGHYNYYNNPRQPIIFGALLQLGDKVFIQVAEPAWWKAKELHLEGVQPSH